MLYTMMCKFILLDYYIRLHIYLNCLSKVKTIYFKLFGSIKLVSNTFSSDISRINHFIKHSIMNRSKSSAIWSLLTRNTVVATRFLKDTALCNNNNILTEFLFQFMDKTSMNLTEVCTQSEWNNDNYCTLTSRNGNFFSRDNVKEF